MKHVSVLLQESINKLNIKNGKVYADLTLGGGGHSLKILKSLKGGVLVSVDVDSNAIKNFQTEVENIGFSIITKEKNTIILRKEEVKIYLFQNNFSEIDSLIKKYNINFPSGILVDLGWSMDQLQHIKGLSHKNEDDLLDMRLDSNLNVKASDLLNVLGKKQLSNLFTNYADIYGKDNFKLVQTIINNRKEKSIIYVSDLNQIIDSVFVFYKSANLSKYKKIKRVIYQALRIAVNSEYEILNSTLRNAVNILEKNGKLLIISFHSGEEKIIKEFIKSNKQQIKLESKMQPTVEELTKNISSRSAKLWVINKI